MNTENILYTLQQINNDITINKNISLEDLKILLLIIYNELILQSTNNEVIKSYLTIILYNFIALENNYNKINKNHINEIKTIHQLIHHKIPLDITQFNKE